MLRTGAHLAGLGYYVWLLLFVFALRPEDRGDPQVLQRYMDFRTKYFSIWALTAQVVLLSLCVVHDIARLLSVPESNPTRRSLERARDLVFVGVAAPLAVTGCVMYAGLAWWDRDLVMPPALDAAMPWWLNQAMHSASAAQILVQLLADPLGVPGLAAATALANGVSAAYIVAMLHEYLATGRWLYPVLEVLGWPGRVALSVFSVALFLAQVVVFRAVIRARWGSASESVKKNR